MSELRRPITKRTLNAWLKEQRRGGAPAWPLYIRLSDIQRQSENLDEMLVLAEAMRSIEDEIVDRNLKGIELEKHGKEEEAKLLYEANVADCFDGSHPYDRLRIIYKYRGDNPNAIRVCEAYIRNSGQDPKLCESYHAEIAKLKLKMESQ
jgi:hypothetical protein